MTRALDTGIRAEQLAADYLVRRGWTILARNWRARHKEIDIIAARANILAFVEVKARRTRSFGHPLDAITRAKRRDLEAAARVYVHTEAPPGHDYRFDAIWLIGDLDATYEIEHLEGAWRL